MNSRTEALLPPPPRLDGAADDGLDEIMEGIVFVRAGPCSLRFSLRLASQRSVASGALGALVFSSVFGPAWMVGLGYANEPPNDRATLDALSPDPNPTFQLLAV